eukprot:1869796-Pyramimonas_sp.AAC.1
MPTGSCNWLLYEVPMAISEVGVRVVAGHIPFELVDHIRLHQWSGAEVNATRGRQRRYLSPARRGILLRRETPAVPAPPRWG